MLVVSLFLTLFMGGYIVSLTQEGVLLQRDDKVFVPSVLEELSEGDIVILKNARVSILFYPHRKVDFEGEGKITIGEKYKIEGNIKSSEKSLANKVLAGVLSEETLIKIGGAQIRASAMSNLLYPVNVKVTTLKPTLRWKGDVTGKVKLYILTGVKELIWLKPVAGSSVNLDKELERGKDYCWSLEDGKGNVRGEGCFSTASTKELERLEELSATIARMEKRDPVARIMFALYLERNGFLDEALENFKLVPTKFKLAEKIKELEVMLGRR